MSTTQATSSSSPATEAENESLMVEATLYPMFKAMLKQPELDDDDPDQMQSGESGGQLTEYMANMMAANVSGVKATDVGL